MSTVAAFARLTRRALIPLGLAACAGPTSPAPQQVRNTIEPVAVESFEGGCPRRGWDAAMVADAAFESGFEPTIAWNRVARSPVLLDVAQQDNDTPTHWLRLHEKRGGQWLPGKTLEGMVSGVMAAVVDSQGLVHVAFTRFDAKGGPFVGSIGPGQPWTVEGPLEPGLGFIQDRLSLVLGAGGDLFLAYADQPTRTLKVATRHGGAWNIETVATGATLWRDHALVRDRRGKLHVIAGDWMAGDVRVYSRAGGGIWRPVVVGQHASGGSLAIDRTDHLHLSWIDWESKQLMYSSGPAAGPFDTTIIAAGDLGNDTSIGVTATGTVHIAYDRRDCEDVHLATLHPGQAWTSELVDAAGQVGSDVDLVLDDDDCVHLAYADTAAWDLKYATGCPGR